MMLTTAAFAAMAASCAPGVAPETLAAIARVESGFSTLALNDNTARREFHPQDKAEAVRLARRLLDAGHSVDLGIMQINAPGNLSWLQLTVEDAFEPCPSIRAGAQVLRSLSAYNTGDPKRGFKNGYVMKVVDAGIQIKAAPNNAAAAAGPPTAPPEVKPHDWDVFGNDLPKEVDAPEADVAAEPQQSAPQDAVLAPPPEEVPNQ